MPSTWRPAPDVSVLGPLPQGLPQFAIPWITTADIVPVLIGGCAVAMVSFADTSVLSRAYAARTGTAVDPNQEMVGLGAANLAAGFFQGFPISSSSSRTPVAEAAGARTQLTGVVGALAVALLLAGGAEPAAEPAPTALAAVVIASAIGLFEVNDLIRIYRIQRWEFWLSIVCFVGVAVFGAIPGIGFAIVIAVIEFLWDGWRPHSAVLGRADGVKGYHDITRYPDARQIPGLVLFRWDAPLFFANAEFFKERVLDAVARSPTPVRWLVVAAEPVTSVDVTAADALAELDKTLEAAGIDLRFAELKDPVKDKLKRFGLFAEIGEDCFFPTIGAAVSSYLDHPSSGLGRLGAVIKGDAALTRASQAEHRHELAARLRSRSRSPSSIWRPSGISSSSSRRPLAILPLAGWMGRATEQLAERMGEGVGGLLNATFGNAAELIIALAALRAGLHDVVKASIAGSIVGNILLVLGAAMLAGGLRAPGAALQCGRSALAGDDAHAGRDRADPPRRLSQPARRGRRGRARHAERLDLGRAAPRLRAVPRLLAGHPCLAVRGNRTPDGWSGGACAIWTAGRAAAVLAAATVVIAWMSEILVGAIEPTAHESRPQQGLRRRLRRGDPGQCGRARDRDHARR